MIYTLAWVTTVGELLNFQPMLTIAAYVRGNIFWKDLKNTWLSTFLNVDYHSYHSQMRSTSLVEKSTPR